MFCVFNIVDMFVVVFSEAEEFRSDVADKNSFLVCKRPNNILRSTWDLSWLQSPSINLWIAAAQFIIQRETWKLLNLAESAIS